MITDFTKVDKNFVGQKITIGGYVHTIRDHGGLIFIDLRNENELFQCVIDPERNKESFEIAEKTSNESVLRITGTVQPRSQETINPNLKTGEVELDIETIEVVSKAKPLPFNIHEEGDQMAGEEIRLKYRYLDLRRAKLKDLLWKKHDLILAVRNWFADNKFIEIQTPILANSSPEGARDYLVPSRIHPGKFYALPQAPQQFKQLMMVGGISKYFQIAPCFRDEDPRADRHPGDFYQIDSEIAWAEPADILDLSERLAKEVFAKFSDKELKDAKFTRITHQEALNKYGSDKPDLRCELAWQDAKPVFANSGFKVFADLCKKEQARVQALVIKGKVTEFSRSDLDRVQDIGRNHGLPGIAYIQYFENGAKSPIFKFFGETEAEIEAKKKDLDQHFNLETGDLVLFIANEDKEIVYKAQDQMRKHIGTKLGDFDKKELKFVWIDGFPFFEKDEKSGKIDFGHNPFSVWEGGYEALKKAKEQGEEALLNLRAKQYDIALNGYEVLSGGVRNQNPESLAEAFRIVGYTDAEVKSKFGHMLEAYSYGAPTHAGFAWGLDRLFMVLIDEPNIREVIAFPKNGAAMDTMLNSPCEVRDSQLKELGIKVDIEEE